VSEKFVAKMREREVVHDTVVLADFISIWCDGHHKDRPRRPAETDGARLGIYGSRPSVLCEECEAHLAYAEQRRAYCPKDPKPFCAHCDTHCYRPAEREWQREMMRYAGPKSWRRGHAIDGIKHALEARRYRKHAQATTKVAPVATAENPNDQEESR
jgi:Nitrous oxide-stimulated promoter